MLSAKLISDVLIVVVVPETVKSPEIVTSDENAPVVPDIAFVPAPTPDEIAPSTYDLFAASVPNNGVATSRIKLAFMSMWSPT